MLPESNATFEELSSRYLKLKFVKGLKIDKVLKLHGNGQLERHEKRRNLVLDMEQGFYEGKGDPAGNRRCQR